MTTLRHADLVRVKSTAPAACRPGAAGRVVELRRLEDEGVGCRLGPGADAVVVVVELDDGVRLEL